MIQPQTRLVVADISGAMQIMCIRVLGGGGGNPKYGRVGDVIVAVEYTRPHPLYKKPMRRTSRFAAHDERNLCRTGDIVRIEETRPLSKRKRWIVREIMERGVQI